MATGRGYASGHYAVEIEGAIAGYCKKVDIGKLKAEIAVNNGGPMLRQKKQAVKMSWDKITFEVGLSHSSALLEWMQAAFKMNHQRKNGAILYFDHNFNAMRRCDWTDGHLVEITLPKLDAKSAKDGLYVTLGIQPETIRFTDGGGKVNPTIGTKQKLHQATNFKIDIPGLDTSHVSSIELPKYTLKVVEHAVGEHNESQYEPAAVENGDLSVTFSAHQYKKLYDDAHKFLVAGDRSEEIEKRIGLQIMGPDTKTPTVEFNFENCGYKEVVFANASEANKEEIANCKATFYCEYVDMQIPQKNM